MAAICVKREIIKTLNHYLIHQSTIQKFERFIAGWTVGRLDDGQFECNHWGEYSFK